MASIEYLSRIEDRGDAHRDGFAGNVVLAEEVGGGVLPGHQVESDQPRATVEPRTRLVESDVSRSADAEDLEIDAADELYRFLVAVALVLGDPARKVPAGDVDIFRSDVELREEVLPHEPMVGVKASRVHREVFVEIEGDHVGEGEPFLPVHPDQLPVGADRRGARGKPEHRPSAGGKILANDLRDPARHEAADIVVILHDDGTHALWSAHRW